MNRVVLAGMLSLVVIFSTFNPFMSTIESSNPILRDQIAGIQFENDSWQNVLKSAKRQKKLIFLFAYTSTCTSCREIWRNTFADQEVGVLFNRNFINMSVDLANCDVPPLAIGSLDRGYPILIISDEDGKMIALVSAYTRAKELIDFAKLGLIHKKMEKISI